MSSAGRTCSGKFRICTQDCVGSQWKHGESLHKLQHVSTDKTLHNLHTSAPHDEISGPRAHQCPHSDKSADLRHVGVCNVRVHAQISEVPGKHRAGALTKTKIL